MSSTTTPPADLLTGLAGLAAASDLSVGADGFNPHFNYAYMTEDALFTAARAALAEVGLSGTLSFPSGQHETVITIRTDRDGNNPYDYPQILATVTAVLTIRDQAGNSIECSAFGQGMDPADKAYAKAMTMAAKYAVQKALMIAVAHGDDTDAQAEEGRVAGRGGGARGSSGAVASEKQLGFMASLVKKHHLATSDPEHMAWRLARMAGDSATEFSKIGKQTASAVIDKLNAMPDREGAGAVVVERLIAWETENGLSTATPGVDDVPFTDTTAAGQPDVPVPAEAATKDADGNDIPF